MSLNKNENANESNTSINDDLELPDEMAARVDEVYDAMAECLCTIAGEELEHDMEIIGAATDAACDILCEHGYRVRFPGVVTDEKTGKQHIEEYYTS